MKKFNRHFISALVVIVSLGISFSATADRTGNSRAPEVKGQLPTYYPAVFESVGKITNLDSRYTWSINGKQIKVSSNLSIHSLATEHSSMYSIKKGMNIAYRTNSTGYIVEVWELKNNSIDLN